MQFCRRHWTSRWRHRTTRSSRSRSRNAIFSLLSFCFCLWRVELASIRARRVGLDTGVWPRVHLTVVSAGHIDGQDPRRSQAAGGTRGHLPPHQLLSLPRGNPTSERLQIGCPYHSTRIGRPMFASASLTRCGPRLFTTILLLPYPTYLFVYPHKKMWAPTRRESTVCEFNGVWWHAVQLNWWQVRGSRLKDTVEIVSLKPCHVSVVEGTYDSPCCLNGFTWGTFMNTHRCAEADVVRFIYEYASHRPYTFI